MPLKCSLSMKNDEDVKNDIFISDMNLIDINKCRDMWAKYWRVLLNDKNLLEFEEKSLKMTYMRRSIAGPSKDRSIGTYTTDDNTFSKQISNDEVDINTLYHTQNKNAKFTPQLIDIKDIPNTSYKKLIMNNLLRGIDKPKIICNIILHQTIFDKKIIEDNNDSMMMGSKLYELSFSIKEMVRYNPISYISSDLSKPTIRAYSKDIYPLIDNEKDASTIIDMLMNISKTLSTSSQNNIGYNLLIIKHNNKYDIYIINPHLLPAQLQTPNDNNSMNILSNSLYNLSHIILRSHNINTSAYKTQLSSLHS